MHVPDRQAFADAADLITLFGVLAADEAASRAEASRGLGNVVHYCRWRQIERFIVLMSFEDPIGTVH